MNSFAPRIPALLELVEAPSAFRLPSLGKCRRLIEALSLSLCFRFGWIFFGYTLSRCLCGFLSRVKLYSTPSTSPSSKDSRWTSMVCTVSRPDEHFLRRRIMLVVLGMNSFAHSRQYQAQNICSPCRCADDEFVVTSILDAPVLVKSMSLWKCRPRFSFQLIDAPVTSITRDTLCWRLAILRSTHPLLSESNLQLVKSLCSSV